MGAGRGAQAARTFRVKPLLVISVLAAAAAVVAMVAHILELTLPDSPDNGAWKLNDFGTNLTVAGALTAVTMVLGAIAWCAGFRWGAGLAGGAGAALAGWVALALGQAELVVSRAQQAPLGGSAVTRDIGYWAPSPPAGSLSSGSSSHSCARETTGGPASIRGSPPSVRWPRSPR